MAEITVTTSAVTPSAPDMATDSQPEAVNQAALSVAEDQDSVLSGEHGTPVAEGQAGLGDVQEIEFVTQDIFVGPGDIFPMPPGVVAADLVYEQDPDEGGTLVVTLPNGAILSFVDWFTFDIPPVLAFDNDTNISGDDIVASVANFDPEIVAPAGGNVGGGGEGGANFSPYASGDIGPGGVPLDLLGGLPNFPFALVADEDLAGDPPEGVLTIGTNTMVEVPMPEGENGEPIGGAISGTFGGAFEDSQPNQHVGVLEEFNAKVDINFVPEDNEILEDITHSNGPTRTG